MAAQFLPGFFGKFPARGDFVSQRLPRGFLDVWDGWLQSAIASSRQQLGPAWLDLYLHGPIWRFALSPGLCGQYPWCGVLMPSVDEVGRYFPLTLACPLPLDANPLYVATQAQSWFAAAEEVVLGALDGGAFDMAAFDAAVLSLQGLDTLAANAAVAAAAGFGSAWRLALADDGDLHGALSGLSHQLLTQRLGNYSLWWGLGCARVDPSLLVCASLPAPQDFAAMLSGEWGSGEWDNWSRQVAAPRGESWTLND